MYFRRTGRRSASMDGLPAGPNRSGTSRHRYAGAALEVAAFQHVPVITPPPAGPVQPAAATVRSPTAHAPSDSSASLRAGPMIR